MQHKAVGPFPRRPPCADQPPLFSSLLVSLCIHAVICLIPPCIQDAAQAPVLHPLMHLPITFRYTQQSGHGDTIPAQITQTSATRQSVPASDRPSLPERSPVTTPPMPSTPIQQEKRPIPADPFTWDPPPLGQGPGIRLEDVVWANQVRKKLERYFQYPPAARQDLTDTRVVIELHISPKGRLLDYRWIKRSRHRIFNQTAYLACLQAAPFPMPPQGIQERFLKIRIPFNYTLYR